MSIKKEIIKKEDDTGMRKPVTACGSFFYDVDCVFLEDSGNRSHEMLGPGHKPRPIVGR